MKTSETDFFRDVPDPVRSPIPAAPTDAEPPSERSLTRPEAIFRRRVAFGLAVLLAVAGALALGLRADLHNPVIAAQLALWTLAVPVGLALAVRPGRGGFPLGVTALRIGLIGVFALFVGLAMMPVAGMEVPLTPQTLGGCLSTSIVLAFPPLILATIVLRRAFLSAPALRGAVVGAVCGLAGATTLHSHCPVVSASHVLLAHGLPILLFSAAGAIWGVLRGRP